MANDKTFHGRRVLVVEDDMMIAMMVEDMLIDLGCQVIGPARDMSEAFAFARDAKALDLALLDINLGSEMVFPVADMLRARGIRLIFCSGYGETALRASDSGCAVLRKPSRLHDLAAALADALTGG